MTEPIYDIVIIGGGINGCGIARDAAGRGLKVLLVEQSDLASGTSSTSTKLIHGGLRYLEHYEFRLVREALIEREVLLRNAPHIIWPLRFVLPHHAGLRPAWLVRLGLWLYDHLGGRKLLPGTRTLDLSRDPAGTPLRPEFRRAFEYSDCWVDDARLVVLTARDAANRGATIATRTQCTSARRVDGIWHVSLSAQGKARTVQARALVNAAGPWVGEVLAGRIATASTARTRLVKGSHIIVDRLFTHDRAYIFQNADGRICFAIPYERDFTLIGTTDEDFTGDPRNVAITEGEIDYLIAAASTYFKYLIDPATVRWTYAGVRPLFDDGASKAQEATRDYVLKLDLLEDQAPLLSVFGGKITTYRRLAEEALEALGPHLPAHDRKAWTATAPLPGGDFDTRNVTGQRDAISGAYPFLPGREVDRLLRAYGTLVPRVLGSAASAEELGRRFGASLAQREVDYLVAEEWAQTAQDILWRRSKLGLFMTPADVGELERYLAQRKPAQ